MDIAEALTTAALWFMLLGTLALGLLQALGAHPAT